MHMHARDGTKLISGARGLLGLSSYDDKLRKRLSGPYSSGVRAIFLIYLLDNLQIQIVGGLILFSNA